MMETIYSYVLRTDDGAAPNPLWGICTLTICKPVIRRTAKVGDWVIGVGSANAKVCKGKFESYSNKLVYAMKITAIKALAEYDAYCFEHIPNKIPQWDKGDWKSRVGDCIYDYSNGDNPILRKGVHNEYCRNTDLSGCNALLSDCFFYFGKEAKEIPPHLHEIVKKNRGHKKIINPKIISDFEAWITQFEQNKLYADPINAWFYMGEVSDEEIAKCSKICASDDAADKEEIIN